MRDSIELWGSVWFMGVIVALHASNGHSRANDHSRGLLCYKRPWQGVVVVHSLVAFGECNGWAYIMGSREFAAGSVRPSDMVRFQRAMQLVLMVSLLLGVTDGV